MGTKVPAKVMMVSSSGASGALAALPPLGDHFSDDGYDTQSEQYDWRKDDDDGEVQSPIGAFCIISVSDRPLTTP